MANGIGSVNNRVQPTQPNAPDQASESARRGQSQPASQPAESGVQQPADGIDRQAPSARTAATQGGTTNHDRMLQQLQDQNQRLARRNAELSRRVDNLEGAQQAEAAQEAEEARQPGFMRALMEIFEFVGRFMTPVFNLASLAVRALRVGHDLLTGKEVDWKKEGLRMATDLAGVFFPPAGALGNSALNVWFNESQILGGVNELWDDAEKENPFRNAATNIWDGAKEAWDGAKTLFTGNTVAPGSDADNGVRPLQPQEVTI